MCSRFPLELKAPGQAWNRLKIVKLLPQNDEAVVSERLFCLFTLDRAQSVFLTSKRHSSALICALHVSSSSPTLWAQHRGQQGSFKDQRNLSQKRLPYINTFSTRRMSVNVHRRKSSHDFRRKINGERACLRAWAHARSSPPPPAPANGFTMRCRGVLVGPLADIFSHSPRRT